MDKNVNEIMDKIFEKMVQGAIGNVNYNFLNNGRLTIDKNSNAEEKSNAYEKIQNINYNKGKEDALEKIILDTHNIKSFIKIKDDQISVTLSSKKSSYKEANNIIRTIQKEFKEKKYITVKYQ